MFRIGCIIIGYLIGCFQTAYLVGKLGRHIDIREFGSGNAGTTNVIRVMGWKAGIITFIGDFFKAVIAVRLCMAIWSDSSAIAGLYAGSAVIIGHNWPVFLNFKGGKGIASTIGVLLALDFRIGLIAAGVLAITIFISRYVSLGSIVMAISIPVLFIIFSPHYENILLGVFLMSSALYRHRSNIKRLLSGAESKLGQRSTKKVEEN
jgi:glycerol-3-phosphate acyltransferase PlsY